jgi:hypothetical protein
VTPKKPSDVAGLHASVPTECPRRQSTLRQNWPCESRSRRLRAILAFLPAVAPNVAARAGFLAPASAVPRRASLAEGV